MSGMHARDRAHSIRSGWGSQTRVRCDRILIQPSHSSVSTNIVFCSSTVTLVERRGAYASP